MKLLRFILKPHSINGFTLAELLIALAILGVIATFTIPKVLQSQQDQQNKATLKESLATVNAIIYNGSLQGEVDGTNVGDYIISHINAIKICNSNSSSQGCWDESTMGDVGDSINNLQQVPGVVLANGAVLIGLQNCCASPYFDIRAAIDVNGPKPPNQLGQDQMQFLVFLKGGSEKPGRITAWDGNGGTGSVALYDSVFNSQ